MSDLNEKIRHLGQLRETQQLQELIKSTDTADVSFNYKESIVYKLNLRYNLIFS